MILSIIASVALILIGLFGAFSGWLVIMQHRMEPQHTTRAAMRGGWVWLLVGFAIIIWGIARLF